MSTFHSDTDPPANPSAVSVSPEHLVAPTIATAGETEVSAPAIYETEFNKELSESNGLVERDATAAANEADAEAAAAAAAIADVFAADTVAEAVEAPDQIWGPSKINDPSEEPEAPQTSNTQAPSAYPSGPAEKSPTISTSISTAQCALPGCTRPGFAHLKHLCPCHYPRKPNSKKWVQTLSGDRRSKKDKTPRCTVPNCNRQVSRGTKCRVHHWESLNRHPDDAMMPKLCTAEGCNRLGAPLTEGMCWPHYSEHREQLQEMGYCKSVSDAADRLVDVRGASHAHRQKTANSS